MDTATSCTATAGRSAWFRSACCLSLLAGLSLMVGCARNSTRIVLLNKAKFNPITRTISGDGLVVSTLRYCAKGQNCQASPVFIDMENKTVTVGVSADE